MNTKYAKLIDKLAEIEGEIRNNLDLETEELTKHNQQCTHAEAHYRGLMSTSVEQIAVYTVQPPRPGKQMCEKSAESGRCGTRAEAPLCAATVVRWARRCAAAGFGSALLLYTPWYKGVTISHRLAEQKQQKLALL